MTKKIIKQLVLQSYTNNNLDQEKVTLVANQLKREDLKKYLKALKRIEEQRTVVIASGMLPSEKDQKKFEELFTGKKVVFTKDASLIVGVKIMQNDIITDYSLKTTLENMVTHATTL